MRGTLQRYAGEGSSRKGSQVKRVMTGRKHGKLSSGESGVCTHHDKQDSSRVMTGLDETLLKQRSRDVR